MSPVTLRGERVRLRPFIDDELDRVLDAHRGGSSSGEFADRRDRDRVLERLHRSGTWTDDAAGLVLAIEAEDRLVGEVQARGGRSQLLPADVFEIGLELYDEADRRRGIGTDAVRTITAYLFDEEGARRVQISTDVGNEAMRRASDRAGFRFEGVLRGFAETVDGLRDYAIYGMTRDDYRGMRQTWTRAS